MEEQRADSIEASAPRLSEVLRQAAERLTAGGIESGALDAEILLGHVLGIGRARVVLAADEPLTSAQLARYESALARRVRREPVAYITGRREFWSLDFGVTPSVLIPRPETELLVAVGLQLATELAAGGRLRIVDVGTGSGAIAVALASELTNASIVATDLSAEALAIAEKNAVRNGVAGRIRFTQGDLFEALERKESFDLIVSNPPYISRDDIDLLAPEVSRWEPRRALDGGWDGLDYYRRIASEAFHQLAPKGALAVEIGAGTGEAVAALFQDAAGCAAVTIHRDYAGLQRIVVARKLAAR